MAEKKDAYATLEINKNASPDEIKQAYRRLAKKYHPDLNHEPGAAEKFKEVQEAYDVLSDADKKAKYDQFGWPGVDPQAGGGFGQGGFNGFNGFNGGVDVDINDIFSSFFNGGSRSSSRARSGPSRGEDTYTSLRVSFMDSVKGVTKTIPITYYKLCSSCHGSGAYSSSDIENCPRCNGLGRVRVATQSLFGQVVSERTCPDCGGSGKRIKNRCTCCNGTGYEKVKENYDLKIPQGINNGRQLRLAGKGEPGKMGGECGDLYIEMNVEASSTFKRDGNDIHLEFPISPVDAILGATLEVPTVYGMNSIIIPPSSQNGDVIRIKGKGIKSVTSNNYGDQYVHLLVKIPKGLTKEEKAMYEAIKIKEVQNKNRPSEAYSDSVKRMYKL